MSVTDYFGGGFSQTSWTASQKHCSSLNDFFLEGSHQVYNLIDQDNINFLHILLKLTYVSIQYVLELIFRIRFQFFCIFIQTVVDVQLNSKYLFE